MKKLLLLVATMFLVLGMSACGGTEETIATCLLGGCLSYQKYKKDRLNS